MVSTKRFIIFLILGVSIVSFFSSCKKIGFGKTEKEKDILQEKGDIILNAFLERDVDSIKEILSTSALNTSDLQKGFDYCSDLLSENIASSEEVDGPVSDYWNSGKSSKKADATFLVTTTSGQIYSIYFEYWYKSDFDNTKLGVNRIRIVDNNAALLDPEFKKSSDYVRAGIYNPEWDEKISNGSTS